MATSCCWVSMVAVMFSCVAGRINASIMISATPSSTVAKGTAVQVVCFVHTEIDAADRGQCAVTWSRNYHPGREQKVDTSDRKNLEQPRFVTTLDATGRPLSSSVHILQMAEGYRGTYTCKLTCDGYSDSATIAIDILTVPVTFGATIGTLVAFLLTSIILVIAFFLGCRPCSRCCGCPVSNSRRVSNTNSSESLLSSLYQREADMAPPRYSQVVSLPRDGADIDTNLVEETSANSNGILVLQPPSYDDALKNLAAKGIVINCNQLKPMPPAYSDIPFIVPLSDCPGGSPA